MNVLNAMFSRQGYFSYWVGQVVTCFTELKVTTQMPKKDFLKLFSMSLCFTLLQNMDLQKFHKIDENLTSGEVAQLKFLCMDLIPKKRLETVTDAKELFLRLDEQALLDDGLLVPELLITIRRLDLLGILEISKDNVERNLLQRDTSSKGVSAYRYEENTQ